jgi:RND family efflux transporter MFP subunit
MTTTNRQTLIATLLTAAFSLTLSGCGGNAQSQALTQAEAPEPVIPVESERVESGSVRAFYRSTAVLEADLQARLVAEATGLVTEILVEEGDAVSKGDVLARLDTERASLEVARKQADLARLQRALERQQELVKRGMASAEAMEQIQAEFEMTRAALALVDLTLEKANIRAPFDGVVTERLVKLGQQVKTYQETFALADFSSLKAVMDVPERNSSALRPAQAVDLDFMAYQGTNTSGWIERVSPVVNPTTGTVRVTVAVANEDQALRPGMLAQIEVMYTERTAKALIPSDAIVLDDQGSTVYVIRDGLAHQVSVSTGLTEGRQTEITRGLEAGQVVVTAGQNRLEDGVPVASITAGP